MRRACLLMIFTMVACADVAAMAAEQPSLVAQSMSDFARNIALGATLQMREGTKAEVDELRILADRGPKLAREAIASHADAADAQYALGSWLLYGYRPEEADQISFDAQGNATTEQVTRIVQGLSDYPGEGLAALRKAIELAPANGEYAVDYAAALVDYDRSDEATAVLKDIWAGQPARSIEVTMRAGLLLSAIAENNGDLNGAREWVYSALSLDPLAAPAVERLQALDAAALAAAQAPPAAEAGQTEEGPQVVEPTPPTPEENAQQQGAQEQPQEGGQYQGSEQ